MNKLKINLENCFGIRKLEHEFDFSKKNSVLIYAPNGVMKSSLAKTFACIAKDDKKDKPRDLIYPERKSKYEIFVDEKPIDPNSIFVVDPDREINTDDKISTFLASKELKNRYDEIHGELEKSKGEFLKKLKEKSQSSDCESEVISTYKENDKDDFFTCLLHIENEINKTHTLYTFRYNDVFDKKGNVVKFIDKNKELIQQYFNQYKDLLEKSFFFKSNNDGVSFGTFQANQLLDSVADDSFFYAKHKLILSDNREITSKKQLQQIVNDEITKVLNDEKLKESFDKIDKAIGGNAELRAFKSVIEKDKTIIPLLLDYVDFKKRVWYGYFYSLREATSELIKVYKAKIENLTELLKEAKKENETWKNIIDIYNERFFVPFVVSIKNQEDIILKQETANLAFMYKDKNGEPVEKHRDELLTVLSKGEKRAFFILQFLFEVEARKKAGNDNIIILDDIADSFDYKNKYAIIEYIKDLNDNNKFKQIILTHNFDFYRTLDYRLNLTSSVFMAIVNQDCSINLQRGEYRRDVFEKYFTNKATDKKIFVSLIPFVRNIIEYTKGSDSDEYNKLTSCLHIKSDSKDLLAKDICEVFKNNISHCKDLEIPDFENDKIIDLIKTVADKITKESPVNEILLENKLVVSIAIRLITEEFLIQKLNGNIDLDAITSDQTRNLISAYKKHCSDHDILSALDHVNLMTPENIHVNTFMYEPLIDMSINHLIVLYQDIMGCCRS